MTTINMVWSLHQALSVQLVPVVLVESWETHSDVGQLHNIHTNAWILNEHYHHVICGLIASLRQPNLCV